MDSSRTQESCLITEYVFAEIRIVLSKNSNCCCVETEKQQKISSIKVNNLCIGKSSVLRSRNKPKMYCKVPQ